MIAKVIDKKQSDGRRVRGSDPVGLALYLFGPGKHNEHVDPHIVAADVTLGVPDGHRYTDKRDIIDLGHDLNAPHKLFGTEFPGGHVWHLVLSNDGKKDRLLADEEWAEIARSAMDKMGFTESSGKAACRWFAVRHGLSIDGNDHIHIAVNLIREDGTKASIWNDRRKLQTFAAEMERRYGLAVIEGRSGAGLPGVTRAEKEIAARTGQPEPARLRLTRAVRAAAVASASEAEFVRRLRGTGVLARPRYGEGGRTEVVGYSVALRPVEGGKPVWFGGGKLAPDLTLARLRAHWKQDVDTRREAVEEWIGEGPARTGREARVLRAEAWTEAEEQINGVLARLAEVDVEDWETWAGVAREAAGIYAALSARLEGRYPGPLARAAEALSRSAQSRHGQPRARRSGVASPLRGVQMIAIQARSMGRSREGEAMLIRSMFRIVGILHDVHAARGEATQSARLAVLAQGELAALHRSLIGGGLPQSVSADQPTIGQAEGRVEQQPGNRPDRDRDDREI
ncbi:relaxase/mobilization nuclease domain-containing protein [Streptomyces sp. NPDC049577]|uniref:relaxase/mobilization nuclease domain-containing protein n=1 Tax=Streptomyces sp. NPDC049577 TaxID=3155153 RepID=UPI003431E6B3